MLGYASGVVRILPLLAVALAVLFGPSRLFAQAEVREEARQHYERGLALTNSGDYAGALQAFREAYTKSPHFFVLYNVGQAEVMLGHPVEAIAALKRYLTDGGAEIPEPRRQEVEKQISELEARLSELTVTTDRAGAIVTIDGKEIGTTPLYEPVRLAAGRHAVVVKEGDRSQITAVELAEGERRTLSLTVPEPVPPPKAPPPAIAPPTPVPAPIERDTEASSGPWKLVGYGALAAGGATGIAALSHFLWNRGRYQDWKTEHGSLQANTGASDYRRRQLANNTRAESIDKASRVTVTLAVVASALVAGGGVLVLTNSGSGGDARTSERGISIAWAGGREATATAWTAW